MGNPRLEFAYTVEINFQGIPYNLHSVNFDNNYRDIGYHRVFVIDASSFEKAVSIGRELYTRQKAVVEMLYHLTENNNIDYNLIVSKVCPN